MKQNRMYAVIMLEVAKRSLNDLSEENYNRNYTEVIEEIKYLLSEGFLPN